MEKTKLLIVEDEEKLRLTLKDYFEENKYSVLTAKDGEEGISLFQNNKEDLSVVILDGMLPKKDGFEILKEIREESDVPVIMLSARESEEDQVMGFRLGADMYVTKPFMITVLREQVNMLIARKSLRENILQKGEIVFDLGLRRVSLAGKELDTTPKEYEMLLYFARNDRIVLDRNTILDAVWGIDYYGDYRTVDTIVKQLRKKLTEEYPYIKSVYGVGYYFEV